MKTQPPALQTATLPAGVDSVAPDGAAIRVLLATDRASMAHGTLAVGQVSAAVVHRTIDELWYVVGGRAELWRQLGDVETTVTLTAGDALTIPVGTAFQYRTLGGDPFAFVMCTLPRWPGDQEAVRVQGIWPD